ncbi:uncharacterized protein I303_102525 [Kwoniella dejecticola CBS 10117]|uniref:Sec39 domain-containing protein n=1 Tax=Kwoniella dejecticola CBS 10117 TaxID=1296121 RepID=A0A1A6A900_9TREE|nr:uncharacterized protein I303_02539 [Kwoniella dejecticola CBS 10117]OBR86531.1 hypothetical protein I303_02539 [Kwoniella dejecticola CBS 10117]
MAPEEAEAEIESEQPSTALLDPLPTSIPLTPTELLELPSEQLTLPTIESTFAALSDSEVLSLSRDLIGRGDIHDVQVIRLIVQLGQQRGSADYTGLEDEYKSYENKIDFDVTQLIGQDKDKTREEVIKGYVYLEEIRRRLDTWDIISPTPSSKSEITGEVRGSAFKETGVGAAEPQDEVSKNEEMELDDPWGEDDLSQKPKTPSALLDDPWSTSEVESPKASTSKLEPISDSSQTDSFKVELPLTLPSFLSQPVYTSALDFASSACLVALKTVCERHHPEVYPYRFAILDAVPGWISPTELEALHLLPSLGEDDLEKWLSPASTSAPRTLFDILNKTHLQPSIPTFNPRPQSQPGLKLEPLTSLELTQWYIDHITSLDSTGILDNQLAFVQHGASLGVNGLDEVGEDLSLLSRLVYDSNLTPTQHARWNLGEWRKSSSETIIQAYLSNSSPESIVSDLRRLVLPYLYVLESRAERAGQPSKDIVEQLLYDCILTLDLERGLPIFENSKATLPPNERIIKNDLDVARLALALLYGTTTQTPNARDWGVMSSIFECLPVWELDGTDIESDSELTSTTLESIAAFITPTPTSISGVTGSTGLAREAGQTENNQHQHQRQQQQPTTKDLFLFFHPLPFSSLSRALDILDIHLESGEILSKWQVHTGLNYLLQGSKNKDDQRNLAEKLVRKQVAIANGSGMGMAAGMMEDRWISLWSDMNRLSGGEDQMQELLRGALGLLSKRERGKIFLSGVLRSGNFDVSRKIIQRLNKEHSIDDQLIEEVVLEISKEFYLSAESGNLHTGDMKLAYDVLALSPPTNAILSEKSFIEATSRLTTFSSSTSSGGTSTTLSPAEIRYSPNPLKLIEDLLDNSRDSYKYPDMILDLANKLIPSSQKPSSSAASPSSSENTDASAKFRAEVRDGLIRLMIGRSAFKYHDYPRSKDCVEKTVDTVRKVSKVRSTSNRAKKQNSRDDGMRSAASSSPNASQGQEEKQNQLIDEFWKLAYDLSSPVPEPKSESSSTSSIILEQAQAQSNLDIPSKMTLLSYALEFCPPSEIPRILSTFRLLEEGRIKLELELKRKRQNGRLSPHSHSQSQQSQAEGLTKPHFGNEPGHGDIPLVEERVLGSRTAAKAAKLLEMNINIGSRFDGLRSKMNYSGSPHLGGSPVLPNLGLGQLPFSLSRSTSRSSARSPIPGAGPGPGEGRSTSVSASRPRSRMGDNDYDFDGHTQSQTLTQAQSHTPKDLFENLSPSEEAERVRQMGRRALVRGVGWLLGAEEGEITGGE